MKAAVPLGPWVLLAPLCCDGWVDSARPRKIERELVLEGSREETSSFEAGRRQECFSGERGVIW